jgi:gamma-glutamylcyclotransferase (GGCT)/AIG2-like uncharacterized protein YtfP
MQHYDVFVYGTLRKGGTNHHYLSDAFCLQNDVWLPGYRLYDFQNAYPFMLPAPTNSEKVRGEIYRVNESILEMLNILEDIENDLYKLVYMSTQQCYTYLKFDTEVGDMKLIRSGDWITYSRKFES